MAGEDLQQGQTTPETVRGDAVVDVAAKAEGIGSGTDDESAIAEAKAKFQSGKETRTGVTRELLYSLARTVGKTAPQTQKQKVDRLLGITARAVEFEKFKLALIDCDHDFEGDDSNPTETVANPVFGEICAQMAEVFADPTGNETLQSHFAPAFTEWMLAASDFIIHRVADSHGILGNKMGIKNVGPMIQLIYDQTQGGPGTFEQFLQAKHGPEYTQYQEKVAALAASKTALRDNVNAAKDNPEVKGLVSSHEGVKAKLEAIEKGITEADEAGKLTTIETVQLPALVTLGTQLKPTGQKIAETEAKLNSLRPDIIPQKLKDEMASIKEAFGKAEDAGALSGIGGKCQALDQQIVDVATLQKLAETPGLSEADQKAMIAEVQKGEKSPAQIKEEYEASKKAIEAAIEKVAGADLPAIDRLQGLIENMPDDSSLKGPLTMIATTLTTLFASLANINMPPIGNWIRKTFISNERLAKDGDEKAKLMIPVERKFHEFGLTRAMAIDYSGKKTSDVVKLFTEKPEEVDGAKDNTEIQDKLRKLGAALKEKGGENNESLLMDFLRLNPTLKAQPSATTSAQPASGPTASPQTAPTAQPTPAPAVAPTVAAGAAGAAAAQPGTPGAEQAARPPEGQPQSPNLLLTQCAIKTDNSLKDYRDKGPIKLADRPINFKFAYPEGTGLALKIQEADCSILPKNEFKVGNYKYKVKLPSNANLDSVEIKGSFANGGIAALSASVLFVSDTARVPLADLAKHLEALRQGPKSYKVPGDKPVEFELIT